MIDARAFGQKLLEDDSMKALRARLEWLADGSLVATLGEWSGSAEDQAVQAARYALEVQERWPQARAVLATGRAFHACGRASRSTSRCAG
jgi:hypothetical protein